MISPKRFQLQIRIIYRWYTAKPSTTTRCFFGCEISDGNGYCVAKSEKKREVILCYTHANPLIPFRVDQRKREVTQ